MKQKILILSASVGAGHLRAAEAVELAAKELLPDAHVENLDVLQMTNRLFQRIYGKFYLDLVNQAPHVLGYFYDLLDRPAKYKSDNLRLILEKLNLSKFVRYLQDQHWDLVINTHFLPAEIIASLRKKKVVRLPQTTVTTDFETHRLWVNQPCDHYFTATEEGALYLEHWGVPKSEITVTGIPIHPVFSQEKSKEKLLAKHGLAADRPVILQLAGGFGVGPIEKLYQTILKVKTPIQLVTVAGKNEKLRGQLEKLRCPEPHKAKVIGFTREIDELMAVADLVVTKPGGLTTSETLASGAIMVIVNPIPGQETRNSDFLLEKGAAIKVNNTAVLAYKIEELLGDAGRLRTLRANVRKVAKPRAAYDVVKKSLEFVSPR